MRSLRVPLAMFVVLTLVLASFAVYEYTTANTLNAEVQAARQNGSNVVTVYTRLTVVPTLAGFDATAWNSSTPATFAFAGVTFSLWTNSTVTFSGGSCYPDGSYGGYVITFADGASQSITTCLVGVNPDAVLRLTTHVNPQAGILVTPQGQIFFFVSDP